MLYNFFLNQVVLAALFVDQIQQLCIEHDIVLQLYTYDTHIVSSKLEDSLSVLFIKIIALQVNDG